MEYLQYLLFAVIFVSIIIGLILLFNYFKRRDEKIMEDHRQNLTRSAEAKKEHKEEPEKKVQVELVEGDGELEQYFLTPRKREQVDRKTLKNQLKEKVKYAFEEVEDENSGKVDEADNDMIDIDAAYKKFVENIKREEAQSINRTTAPSPMQEKKEYTMADFKKDLNSGVDINDIIEKMSPDMKKVVLTTLLERRNFD